MLKKTRLKLTITSVTIQKLIERHSIFKFTLQEFIKLNSHIGSYKQQRDRTNNDIILTTPKNIDIINLSKSLYILRLVLAILVEITFKKGKITTIIPCPDESKEKLLLKAFSKTMKQEFVSFWKPGLLSNFKELYMQKIKENQTKSKKLLIFLKNLKISKGLKAIKSLKKILKFFPNFLFFLSYEKVEELKSELIPFRVPGAVIQNTSTTNLKFLYSIPLNMEALKTPIFISFLILQSIIIGNSKRLFFFSKKKLIH